MPECSHIGAQASAGYDAHMLDPLEKLNYQSATYHALVSSLMSLSDRLCSELLIPWQHTRAAFDPCLSWSIAEACFINVHMRLHRHRRHFVDSSSVPAIELLTHLSAISLPAACLISLSQETRSAPETCRWPAGNPAGGGLQLPGLV